MLAAAVDPGKGLFVQQADEAVPCGQVTQHVHGQHIVVAGDVGFFIDGRELELTGGHLVVARLGRDAELLQLPLHILHKAHDAAGDGAEVVVLHLLPLGRRRALQGAPREHDVRAQGRQTAIHQKIFLFRAHAGPHALRRGVAEQAQDAQRLHGKRIQRAQQGDLAVQGLAGIGVEKGGDVERGPVVVADDEDRHRRIPGRVAAGLEGGADAARREGRGVRFAADEHLARKFVDHVPVRRGGQEGIVLFGREAGHGLEPVGIMIRAHFDGPVLHGIGHHIGNGGIEASALADDAGKTAVDVLGQALAHGVKAEDMATECLRAVRGGGIAHGGQAQRGSGQGFLQGGTALMLHGTPPG